MPPWDSGIIPARLSFLAIYNPALGPTEETFKDQIVFHFSRTVREARQTNDNATRHVSTSARAGTAHDAENERLRQVGLAQGMVNFANSFSDDKPVTSVETAKSRIVLDELESGWWILAVR